jgi:amino acid transporter
MILAQWSGIFFASLLAFFAFIGFEDLANVVEEAKTPHLHIPWAMFLTLAISTGLYIAVAAIAVSAVSPGRLASSPAPLSLVFQEVAGISPTAISAIAIVATLNTILAQMTMATRVIYGLAREGDLPAFLGEVHARTATPLAATALMTVMVIVLALAFRFEALAEVTSLATLVIFVLVNASLLRLRFQRTAQFTSHLGIPTWVPVAGIVSSLAMIASSRRARLKTRIQARVTEGLARDKCWPVPLPETRSPSRMTKRPRTRRDVGQPVMFTPS